MDINAVKAFPKNGPLAGKVLTRVELLPPGHLPECVPLQMKVIPEDPPDWSKVPKCGMLPGPKARQPGMACVCEFVC